MLHIYRLIQYIKKNYAKLDKLNVSENETLIIQTGYITLKDQVRIVNRFK